MALGAARHDHDLHFGPFSLFIALIPPGHLHAIGDVGNESTESDQKVVISLPMTNFYPWGTKVQTFSYSASVSIAHMNTF